MSTLSFSGAISGLDTASIIDALMSAAKAPLTRLQTQQTTLTTQQSDYGDLRTLLTTLENAGKDFTVLSAGSSRLASSSNTTILTAAAGPSAIPASYQVTVNHLATSTVATSTAAIGTAITSGDLGTVLNSLGLPGSVTAGTISMVVDGQVVHATVGDPSTTTLGDVLTAIGDALTTQVQANEGGSGATVAVSVVNNKLQVSLSGSSSTHTIAFGTGGDTSNALAMLGLTGMASTSLSASTPLTGTSSLGVVRTTSSLDTAGLSGLTSGAGTLTINGVGIAYDTTTDSLTTLISRINNSTAGVVASLDRGNDKLVLTAKTGGSLAIDISDTGTLASALNLAPGTTNAQVLGTQAQVTIDGRQYLSDTNKLSGAISGVSLTLLAEGTSTVSVTPDVTSTTSAVQSLVDAYNALADKIDTLTANTPGGTLGDLADQLDLRTLPLSLRSLLTGTPTANGSIQSLADIGVTTGTIGSAAGTTNRLQLDTAKLQAALENDPAGVANLLNSATGAIKPMVDAVDAWTKPAGRIDTSLQSIASTLRDITQREADLQERIDVQQQALQAKFAAMEQTLALLQSQSGALGQMVTASTTSSSSTTTSSSSTG
jgi:flagellar hook-associated protein 2